jgi:hypothetical protein
MRGRVGILTLGLGCLILTIGFGSAWGSDLTSAEKRKIEALISGVEQMTDAVFVRNGKQYPAESTAEFLRRKWKSRRSEVRFAAEFIDKAASFSSTTGKPYSIRWRDGRERLSAEFSKARLALMEGLPGVHSS